MQNTRATACTVIRLQVITLIEMVYILVIFHNYRQDFWNILNQFLLIIIR